MQTRRRNRVLVIGGLLAAAALGGVALGGAAPDDATKAFDAQFGGEIARAAATKDTADDLALAGALVEAARAKDVQPALVALLCEKAFALAAPDPRGGATAVAAMTLLAEKVPEKAAAAQEKALDISQAEYAKARGVDKVKAGETLVGQVIRFADARAGAADYAGAVNLYRRALPLAATLRAVNRDELNAKLDYAATRLGFRSQIEKLEAALKADPNDQAARDELVRIYVVEFDNPAEASKKLDLSRDSVAAKLVLLAGMPIEQLPPRACVELGHWYRGLAETSSAQGRLAALARAKRYYERYLETKDAERQVEAAAALDQVDGVLARTAAAAPKLSVLDAKAFGETYAKGFPPRANLAADGEARASSHWGNRLPSNVFRGNRAGDAWSLNAPKGWFIARWSPAIRGRYIILFARASTGRGDSWGDATVSVNDAKPQKVEGMESGRVLLIDLGLIVPVTGLRIDIKGTTYPGLAAVEVHAGQAPAKPGETEPQEPPEERPSPPTETTREPQMNADTR